MTADVVIIGGGLAGSATALGLAARGLDVALVEKRQFPRDKPCGEGLLPHGVRELSALGLGDVVARCEGQPFAGIIYRCDGSEAIGRFSDGHVGFGMRRLALDAALHEAAIGRPGVHTVYSAARGITIGPRDVTVVTTDGEHVRARALVGADGTRSFVRRAIGLDTGLPRNGRWALRQHFALAHDVAMPAFVEVSFHPGFELYLTPSARGVVGVAALCERDTIRRLEGLRADEKMQWLLAHAPEPVRQRLRAASAASEPLACGPMRAGARAVFRDNVVLVGDAAGYVDAITGEGMSLALRSASLASEALATWLIDGGGRQDALETYARRRRQRVRDAELITHITVHMARRPKLARRVTKTLSRHPDTFTRILSVLHGAPLRTLQVRDLLRLAV